MYRALDILLALILLVVAAVPMIFVSLIIILEDGFPVIFKQVRVGQNLKPFYIYKFRSMRTSVDDSRSGSVIGSDYEDKIRARQQFKTTSVGDARITQFGKFIRKTHLDELPQLMNVLMGDMSMVGVRPDTFAQEVDYQPDYWTIRHALKPGITGLAQVMNVPAEGMSGRTRWEVRWIERRSLKIYFTVLFRTIFKVFKRDSL